MIDPRNFDEIKAAHPMPWRFITVPGMHNGMARIAAIDMVGNEVQMSVLLRVIDIITTRAALQPEESKA